MNDKPFDHAVVLGSGMAGLVAARVLSDHFARVTVVERDQEPGPGTRPGLPQGRHFHAILRGGIEIMSALLPGLTDDLVAAGSLVPYPRQFYFYRPEGRSYALGQYLPEPPPDDGPQRGYVQTRGLLEHCVRSRVAAVDNIELRYGCRIEGVKVADRTVHGVELADGAGTIEADLVVDALGRGSKTPQWLEALGYPPPHEETIECDFAYSSMFVRPRDPDIFEDVGFFVFPDPKSEHPRRGAALVRMEGGNWLVSLGGRFGDYPPKDLPAYRAWARTLPHPRYHELLDQTEPVSEIAPYRFNRAVRRRYEKLEAFPRGLIPIGDAICHYNPLYGQGMSAASRQAMALDRALREVAAEGDGLSRLPRVFLPEAYQETRAPWLFAAVADLSDPQCKGDFPAEEGPVLARLVQLRKRFAEGDGEAALAIAALSSLAERLDMLERSPWSERV